VLEFYNDNRERHFKKPGTGKIHISWIFTKASSDGDPELRTAAFEKIKSVQEKLKNNGNFAELARLFSDDLTAEKGGDLGEMESDKISPALREAAIKLKANKLNYKTSLFGDLISLSDSGT